MIQYPSRIFFSRWEKQDDENQWLYTSAHCLAVAAKNIFLKTFKDELDWWKKWNVIELHGHAAPTLHFVEYALFGSHPFPQESRRFVFYPSQRQVVELKILDPYILHKSYLLIPEDGMGSQDPLNNPVDRKRWFERCDELYRDFDTHHLIDHPQAHYQTGWKELLNLKGLSVFNLPTEEKPTQIQNWKVSPIEVHAEVSFGDL
jgi:hypothetical protein